MIVCATVLLGPGSESSIADAVKSVDSEVDGFIFIESGGGEVAVQAAFASTSKANSVVERFEWTGSYSDARNFAFQAARRHGYEYAITLDPDERVELPGNLRAKLRTNPDIAVWMLPDRDEGYHKERVLKCSSDIRWHGRVCEDVGAELPIARIDGHFWELPKDAAALKRRHQRGIVECRRMIDEGDDRYKWWRHLGSCYAGEGDMDQALHCYREATKRKAAPEQIAWAKYLVCEQLVIRELYDEAKLEAAQALADHAGFIPEFGWIFAWCYFKSGDLQNASRWAQLVLHTPRDTTRVGFKGKNCKVGASQLLARLHAVQPSEVVLPLGSVKVPSSNRFSQRMRAVLASGKYERAEAEALQTLLQDTDRVLELGAGCGYLSTLAAQKLAPGSVVAVEADPDLVEACKSTFAANNVSVDLHHKAIAAPGAVTVNLQRAVDFWSSKLIDEATEHTVAVPAVTLGDMVDAAQPTVIVCDVEGAEQHCCGTPLPNRVRAVLIETHSDDLKSSVFEWLSSQGFSMTREQDRTQVFERGVTSDGQS